jgi:hypothetical protein
MTKNNAIAVTAIISGVILLIAILALVTIKPVSSGNTVTVQGISEIKAMPDLITVYFSIETKGETSAEATENNSAIMEDLTNALIKEGFAKGDIKTESFNVYPNVYWDGTKQKEDGFKASHSVKIELSIDELDKLGKVVDAGVNAGAGISYINFELTQEAQNKYKAEALGLAAEDAQVKADSVAAGFGKSAGKLVSVQVSDFGYYPWNVYTAKSYDSVAGSSSEEDVAMARQVAVNIAPSEQEITASISATFRIK